MFSSSSPASQGSIAGAALGSHLQKCPVVEQRLVNLHANTLGSHFWDTKADNKRRWRGASGSHSVFQQGAPCAHGGREGSHALLPSREAALDATAKPAQALAPDQQFSLLLLSI